MATLTSQQLKDSYQSLVTIGDSIVSNPTSGQLENGLGNPITALGIGTDSPSAPLSIDTGTTGTIAQFRGADTDLLNIDGDSNAITLDARNVASLNFEMQGSEKMRIDSSGNVTITTGNLILDSGAGIDFSDTPNSSGTMTSELLDDYEEGTFTPVVQGSGTAGTYELSFSQAYYTKIGRMVTLHLSFGLDDPITGGGSGYVQISGLPFVKADNHNVVGTVRSTGFDYTGDYLITSFTTAGTTSTILGIFGNQDNASISLTPISGLSAGDSFRINVSYLT